jgi:hypothetical protein
MRQDTHTQRILDLVRQRGLLRPGDLDTIGAPRVVLTRMTASGLLERAGRGIYRLTDRLADIPARGKGSLIEMDDFHAGLRTGWWESMNALFRTRAKRYIVPIAPKYLPKFLRRLMLLILRREKAMGTVTVTCDGRTAPHWV